MSHAASAASVFRPVAEPQVIEGAFSADQSRIAGLAGTVGNLTNSEQGNLGSLGQVAGNLQNADNTTAISAGSKLGDLATAGQTLGLKDAAALQAVGNQQQQQTQQNLDVAYNDFQNQTNYPKDQLSWLNNLIKGYSVPSQTTSTSTTTTPSTSGGTNLGTITGGLSALLGAFSGNAKGGLIKKKRATDPDMDGDVDTMAQAALDFDNDVRSGALSRGKAKPMLPPARRTGLVVSHWGNVRRDLHAACDRAGIPRVSPNDLRRTFASWLKQAGTDSMVVAKLMGHTSTEMVERVYGQLTDDNYRDAIAKLLPFDTNSLRSTVGRNRSKNAVGSVGNIGQCPYRARRSS